MLIDPKRLPEIIFGSSDVQISKQIGNLKKAGIIRKIAPRLYTSNLVDTAEETIRRNLFHIVGELNAKNTRLL